MYKMNPHISWERISDDYFVARFSGREVADVFRSRDSVHWMVSTAIGNASFPTLRRAERLTARLIEKGRI